MSVSVRVKNYSQEASHSPVYSRVAEAAVQPAVGVSGGVTARCGSSHFSAPLNFQGKKAKSPGIMGTRLGELAVSGSLDVKSEQPQARRTLGSTVLCNHAISILAPFS